MSSVFVCDKSRIGSRFCKAAWKHVQAINTPHTQALYSENGVFRGIHFFLFLLENIDCGYMLEPPRQGYSNAYPQSMF